MARRLIALSLVTGSCCFSSSAQSPLPKVVSIVTPGHSIPKVAAAFSGAWLGAWGGELPTALIVEQVGSNDVAKVIYSWGDSPGKNIKAGWERYEGRIFGGKLRLASMDGPVIEFWRMPGGLLGRYQWGTEPPSYADLQPLGATKSAAVVAATKRPATHWEEIRIPVHSESGPAKGGDFQLQATVLRQSTPGRHPVVISNHGSTGPGVVPPKTVFRGGNDGAFFHSLGYVVVVPMRKGRGASDGPHLEENFSLPPAVQLDSAIEDLHAVIRHVSGWSDVDPAKIVLAGVSRGGFLSVAYAGRYPTNVAGVINFSGGWFGEWTPGADFNLEALGLAGRGGKVPMLWLYADHDSYYSLKYVEREFAAFRTAGGRGDLSVVSDLTGDGHALHMWVERWQDRVMRYLNGL